jgi:hypothetical protein
MTINWEKITLFPQGYSVKNTIIMVDKEALNFKEFATLVDLPASYIYSALRRAKRQTEPFLLLVRDSIYRKKWKLVSRAKVYRHDNTELHTQLVMEKSGCTARVASERLVQWEKGKKTIEEVMQPVRPPRTQHADWSKCKVNTPRKSLADIPVGSWERKHSFNGEGGIKVPEYTISEKHIPEAPINLPTVGFNF